MDSVKYILEQPEFIDGVGNIYPIKVKDHDEFIKCHSYIYYSKKHFNINADEMDKHKLLDILFDVGREDFVDKFKKLFSLVLRKEVTFAIDDLYYGFSIDDKHIIDNNNYELVRDVILKQNLLFEPKVFKNKLVQQWAEKVLQARSKNGVKITIEDMITTVSVFKGISYQEVGEMTLYQLHADFKRISRFKGYERDILFKASQWEINNIEHFAEEVDMFEDPYGNVFVKKEKLSGLNKALGQK